MRTLNRILLQFRYVSLRSNCIYNLKTCKNVISTSIRSLHRGCINLANDKQLNNINGDEEQINQELIIADIEVTQEERKEEISKAMKAYLDRAKQYNEFMQKERIEFEIGKRHLCNIMGWDPQTITQKDIDQAIEYLMPSGLFDQKARPVMKPPEELYPKRKEAEFDISGRPFHALFYTGKPNYFQLMHDIHEKFIELNELEDKMIRSGVIIAHIQEKIALSGSDWLSYDEIKKDLLEKISQDHYNQLINSLNRLSDHPYSMRVESFIMKYRKKLTTLSSEIEIPPLTYTENGRPYVKAEGRRKNCFSEVTVWGNGTGLININGHDLLYFKNLKEREQIMLPLQFTDLLFKVDIDAKVTGEGVAAQAGSIRYALSLALRSFVDQSMLEDMRIAGLLTRDCRLKERKKPGQEGARRKFTWQKR